MGSQIRVGSSGQTSVRNWKSYTDRGKTTFTNFADLNAYLSSSVKDTQEIVLNKMLDKLNSMIAEDVYNGKKRGFTGEGIPEDFQEGDSYDPTGSLLEMFGISNIYVKGNNVRGSIDIVNNNLEHNPDAWVHSSKWNSKTSDKSSKSSKSSKWKGTELNAKDLLGLVINGNQTTSIFGNSLRPHTFWEDFQKWARDNYAPLFKKNIENIGRTK